MSESTIDEATAERAAIERWESEGGSLKPPLARLAQPFERGASAPRVGERRLRDEDGVIVAGIRA
jgi:hypothetical protein